MKFCLAVFSFSIMSLSLAYAADSSERSTTDNASQQSVSSTSAACTEKWDAFSKSGECYAAYQLVSGGLKPGAYEKCGTPLPNPSQECGPFKPK